MFSKQFTFVPKFRHKFLELSLTELIYRKQNLPICRSRPDKKYPLPVQMVSHIRCLHCISQTSAFSFNKLILLCWNHLALLINIFYHPPKLEPSSVCFWASFPNPSNIFSIFFFPPILFSFNKSYSSGSCHFYFLCRYVFLDADFLWYCSVVVSYYLKLKQILQTRIFVITLLCIKNTQYYRTWRLVTFRNSMCSSFILPVISYSLLIFVLVP